MEVQRSSFISDYIQPTYHYLKNRLSTIATVAKEAIQTFANRLINYWRPLSNQPRITNNSMPRSTKLMSHTSPLKHPTACRASPPTGRRLPSYIHKSYAK